MKILKNFVVFEGGDGSGTTTQLERLKTAFEAPGNPGGPKLPPSYFSFEPTDGPIGRIIRSGLRGETPLQDETIAFLFAADRNEHIFGSKGIKERTDRGELVICDRYVLSSLVYQGISCGEELPARLNRDFPWPELLLFFDLDPEIAQKRMENRSQREIYESLAFQIQVRNRYRALIPKFEEGCRIEIIDASLPQEEVACEVWRALRKMPILKA